MKMLRILAASAALALAPVAALAQSSPNWTFGQVPTTAQWNAIFASKQDVLGYVPMNVAGGTFTGRVATAAPGANTAGFNLTPGSTPAAPANGDLWTTSSGLFARINGATINVTSTGAHTYTDTQTINPPSGTLNPGLVINQTGPTSGSSVGPWSGNIINSTFGATVTGSSDPFFDNGAWQTWVAAHRVNFTVGGPNLGGEPVGAGFYQLIANTNAVGASDGDFIGLAGEAWANATITNGAFHGVVGAAIIGANSNIRTMNALFAEADILTGGVAGSRRGINIVSQGNTTATGPSDTAINISSSSVAAGFKNLIIIETVGGAIQPIQPTGDIIKSDGAFTIANVLNLPSATVTGNIFNFNKLTVSGAGQLVAGGGTADANTGTMVNAAVPSGGVASLISQVDGAAGFNGFHTSSSPGLAGLFAVVPEPSSTFTIFGQVNANFAEIVSGGPSSNGMLLGTLTAFPLIFGTNNAEHARLTSGGFFNIGPAVAPDSLLTVNNNTGATVAAGVANDLHLIAPNSSNGGVLSDVFNGEAVFLGRASGGTLASKSVVGAGTSYVAFAGQTWDGAGYASNSVLEFQTINAQSGSDHSSKARLRLVPTGSTTLTDVMLWGPGVVIGSGGVDQGAGTLNVTSNYYIGGTLLKNVAETLTNKTISGASNTLSNIGNASLTNSATTVNGQTCTLGATCTISASASSLTIGTTTTSGGTSGRVLYDNAGVLGEYTAAQLTAQINVATTSLSGAVPAWPNNTTTFFRGDGTYAVIVAPAGTLSGATLASNVLASSLTSTGTLTGGATGAGFTVALGTSTVSGLLTGTNGGTGVNNGSSTITIAGNVTHAGAFAQTITATATTNSTLPAGTHTLAGLDVAQTWSALQGFNDNDLALNGSTSGNLVLRAAATAGSGVLRFPAGSTDFSATGGASQVVKQTSSGGAFTVARLACSDLSDSSTGCTTTVGTMATQAASAVAITGGTINGTVIGGSTPAAITATTIAGNTSVTTPLHIGGSGTTGTQLTLQTTTGVGTTDAIAVKGGNNGGTTFGTWNATGLGIGSVAADSRLTVNVNTGASVAIAAGTNVHIVGADAANNIQTFDVYGGQAIFAARRANGTQASKTGLVAGNNIFNININGWDTAAYNTSASIIGVAAETWSASAHGTYFDFNTTPLTSISTDLAMRIYGSGGVSVGNSPFDAGLGKINAQNGFTSGGTSGLSVTKTVRASGGAADCTLIYTGGILTGGSC
jgi:hypothetical protein